jgi:hypothetical protein
LPKWKKPPGMLGVRVEGWPTDGTPTGSGQAEKAGLAIMLLINGRSAQVVRSAERHPKLTLIVDHMGVTADVVKAGKFGGCDRSDAVACQVSERFRKAFSRFPNYSIESYPFRDFLRIFDGCSTRMARNVGTRGPTSPRVSTGLHAVSGYPFHRGTAVFGEDKDWIMGRAIVTRLNWS